MYFQIGINIILFINIDNITNLMLKISNFIYLFLIIMFNNININLTNQINFLIHI